MPRLIGTKHETSLHRDLKCSYAGKGGKTEVEVAGFVADGLSAKGEYIEVQTGHFGDIKKKARQLIRLGKVRIIYPVIIAKYIEVYSAKGKFQYRRKSPKRGNPWTVFEDLVYAPELPLIPGLIIELVMVDAAELRAQDGKGSWRRKGVSIKDRTLLKVHERITLKKPSDYLRFVPFTKKERFTSADLGKKAGIRVDLARQTLYVLHKMGMARKTGKQGNAIVFQLCRAVSPRKPDKKPPCR